MWAIGSHRQVACRADWRLAPPKRSGGDGELRCDADCGTDTRAEGTGVGVASGCFHPTMRQHRRIDNDVKFTELNTTLPLMCHEWTACAALRAWHLQSETLA